MKTELRDYIALKLGETSMCWSETPKGVFQDEKVTMILDEIMERIESKINVINQEKHTTIHNLTDNFVKIAKEKDITLGYSNEYGVDADIFNWLPNATVSTEPVPTGDWTKVDTKGTTEAAMLETAMKMSLSQAITKFTEMLKNGEFDKLEIYRIIFLNETRNGSPLWLDCYRSSDGWLSLSVSKVDPDFVCDDADHTWFSSNKNL